MEFLGELEKFSILAPRSPSISIVSSADSVSNPALTPRSPRPSHEGSDNENEIERSELRIREERRLSVAQVYLVRLSFCLRG